MAKQPLIKKLSKGQLEEGLTVEFVNSINMERYYTPVQLQKGDEPADLLACSTGYFVMVDGMALKDPTGKLIVWKPKDCHIGRARYLLNYGKEEKEQRIKQLMESWTKEVDEKMKGLKDTMDGLYIESFPESATGIRKALIDELYKDFAPEHKEVHIKGRRKLYESCKGLYDQCLIMREKEKIVELMEFLGIRKFPALMLTVKLDNPNDIKILSNTFSASELERWANMEYNRTYKYAQIEIEKQYTV